MINDLPGEAIHHAALTQIFLDARTLHRWQNRPVTEQLLRQIYDIAKMGPTSANSLPLRILFLRTAEAKARLKPHLAQGNVEPVMAAPVTAIFAQDMRFYDYLPRTFPHTDAKSWFAGNPHLITQTAFRNSSLQAAYFMIAARALGLDCGPMSGFSNDGVDKEFFPEGRYQSNFICNLGYGDRSRLHPRNPRLSFEETCEIL